ncbi:MAG: Asp-tRNA(Asn)/Glu-tRNA(Gln) amidotransferase subunit GatC [Candidatus Atribacteria bacterium]|nr:Asp-tRNA(Asn)/Glu-tRNA(Gln) amidotransferase subunit GatC [Candidatus Atribacteria bacterium]
MDGLSEKISLDEIKKMAQLSKLSFSQEELEQFFVDINSVVSHFDKLNQLDLSDVSPTSHISWSQPPSNPDEPREWPGRQEVFAHAPQVIDSYFIVPKVVDKQEE